jgi:soluble lytic murein transglycosylase-like protein
MESTATVDHVSALYRNPDTRALVVAFFEGLTGDYEVARAILDESTERGVSTSLAFALVYEESSFNPKAYNHNSKSIDRGLFQLNSLSFPSLSLDEFYDIDTNVRNGIDHLAFCLKNGGNEVAALAMYNAGLGRVSTGGTPRRTLDYIYRITGYRERLEALFEAQVVARRPKANTVATAPGAADPLN